MFFILKVKKNPKIESWIKTLDSRHFQTLKFKPTKNYTFSGSFMVLVRCADDCSNWTRGNFNLLDSRRPPEILLRFRNFERSKRQRICHIRRYSIKSPKNKKSGSKQNVYNSLQLEFNRFYAKELYAEFLQRIFFILTGDWKVNFPRSNVQKQW